MSEAKTPGPFASELSKVYASAAMFAEQHSDHDAELAIARADFGGGLRTNMRARMIFRDRFGCWPCNDDGVLILCFAAQLALTGDLT